MKHIVTVVLAATLLASCGGDKKETKGANNIDSLKKARTALDAQIKQIENAHPDTSKKPSPVSVLEVKPGTFNGFIEVQSQITGDENVLATPQANGVVSNVTVHVGQKVGKGQVLAMLDAAAVEQQIRAADVQMTFAKTVYEKTQRLWAQQIGTEVNLLKAKADYEVTVKQKEAYTAQRKMYSIVSPISGTVDLVAIKVGDIAMPGGGQDKQGIRIVNDSKLKAEANLGENYLGKVKTGDPVLLLLPDINDSIRTNITYVSQAVDPISRAFNVQIRIGSSGKLHPNMSCRMRITNYQNNNVITVPVSAIQELAGGSTVYIAVGNVAKSVTIKKGRNSNGQVEVLEGLKPGDRVITEGFMDLDNGEAIEVR